MAYYFRRAYGLGRSSLAIEEPSQTIFAGYPLPRNKDQPADLSAVPTLNCTEEDLEIYNN